MGFNKEQELAINFPADKDLVITAGAGSGKTKVLSEHVFKMIDSGEIAPESLLVLTFTNNASYEMKSRILARFGESHPLYSRMLSSHVQSFDSFRAYLVRAYCNELNVPKTFVLMPESIERQKRSEFVDEVVSDCFIDPKKKADLVGFLTRFGFKSPDKVRDCVLYLSQKLSDLSPGERKAYFETYAERFHSEESLRKAYCERIESLRKQLAKVLREALVLEGIEHPIASGLENDDLAQVRRAFSLPSVWTLPLEECEIQTYGNPTWDFLPELYKALCSMLREDVYSFSSKANSTREDCEEYFEHSQAKEGDIDSAIHDHLKKVHNALNGAKSILRSAAEIGPFEEAKEKALWCAKEELFLIGLAREVSDKLGDYKRSVNAFSFADIGFLAIRLFEDESLRDCAMEITSRFDYIVVDEYQDNNDGQEALLNGLMRTRPDGSRAHIFCVGDAKQAIYAFRGSNVDLIRNRAKKYASASDGATIPMNKNYRSAKRLLSDINYIFSSYMRLDNGGIDYLDEAERLQYDDEVNLYNVDTGNYGVRRILPPNAFRLQNKDLRLEKSTPAEYEATAILCDIQRKIREKCLVFDRNTEKGKSHVRPCSYKDFAILVRRKKQIPAYQRLFAANNVPLNNKLSADLREVSPTILLRSILGLLGNRLYGVKGDEAHLFASVARSYAFGYDDTKLHRILTGADIEGEYSDEEKTHLAIENDPIMKQIASFAQTHLSSSFESILLDIVEEFGIISSLPKLGEVEGNISKIESLYKMALAERDLGAGLSDFIAFFDALDEYDIELSSETVSETKDAVDLMTIHASKGLERKIVYMPSSESGIGQQDARNDPPFFFTLEDGICFPYLGYEVPEDIHPDSLIGGGIETIRTQDKKAETREDDAQEHVRILYVALTRAENSFCLVGKKETRSGYVMMEGLPKSIVFHPGLLEAAKGAGCFDPKLYQQIQTLNQSLRSLKMPLSEKEIGEEVPLALELFERLILEPLRKKRMEAYYLFLAEIYEYYLRRFASRAKDVDFLAALFAKVFYPKKSFSRNVDSLASLLKALEKAQGQEDDDMAAFVLPKDKEEWNKTLFAFSDGILQRQLAAFAPFGKFSKDELKVGSKKDPNKINDAARKIFIDHLLPAFASLFDGIPYIAYESFNKEGYEDDVELYDDATFKGSEFVDKPTLPSLHIDDSKIEFAAVEKKRASKRAADPDFVDPLILERGSHLHRLLQLSKLDEKNLDFILDKNEKELILRCLRMDLLQKARKGKAYSEYGYYDPEFDTTGSIDLLFFEENGTRHIVDYKSNEIDDPAYVDQLHVYRRNVSRLFKIKENDIHLHLLSIKRAVAKDVD